MKILIEIPDNLKLEDCLQSVQVIARPTYTSATRLSIAGRYYAKVLEIDGEPVELSKEQLLKKVDTLYVSATEEGRNFLKQIIRRLP